MKEKKLKKYLPTVRYDIETRNEICFPRVSWLEYIYICAKLHSNKLYGRRGITPVGNKKYNFNQLARDGGCRVMQFNDTVLSRLAIN